MVKILDSLWFTTSTGVLIGLVLTENSMGVKKVRAGIGGGKDQERDEQFVAETGGRVPKFVSQFIARADE
jgi:hypothetical protein